MKKKSRGEKKRSRPKSVAAKLPVITNVVNHYNVCTPEEHRRLKAMEAYILGDPSAHAAYLDWRREIVNSVHGSRIGVVQFRILRGDFDLSSQPDDPGTWHLARAAAHELAVEQEQRIAARAAEQARLEAEREAKRLAEIERIRREHEEYKRKHPFRTFYSVMRGKFWRHYSNFKLRFRNG
jgi:hypothetical protein